MAVREMLTKIAHAATGRFIGRTVDVDYLGRLEEELKIEILAQSLGFVKGVIASIRRIESGPETIASDTIAVTNAAVLTLRSGASGVIPTGATSCIIQVRDAPVSEWHNGSTPTTTAGIELTPPGIYRLTTRHDMEMFKVIATTATNAELAICYEQGIPEN